MFGIALVSTITESKVWSQWIAERSVEIKLLTQRSLSPNEKNWFHFSLVFGLSPYFGLSERLIQKVNSPTVQLSEVLCRTLSAFVLPTCQSTTTATITTTSTTTTTDRCTVSHQDWAVNLQCSYSGMCLELQRIVLPCHRCPAHWYTRWHLHTHDVLINSDTITDAESLFFYETPTATLTPWVRKFRIPDSNSGTKKTWTLDSDSGPKIRLRLWLYDLLCDIIS